MAKEKKNIKPREVNSPGIAKYIFIGVLAVILGYFAYTTFIKKEDVKENKNVVIDPRERIKNVKEPPFMKEGELEFIKSDKKQKLKKLILNLLKMMMRECRE